MSDLSDITESIAPTPMTVKAHGIEHVVYPFSMLQVGKIQRAIKVLPCPYNTRTVRKQMSEKLAAGEVTENEVASAVARCAEKEQAWPPRLMEDPEAQDLLYFEETIQIAMVRTALKLRDDAEALRVLEGLKPTDYLRMCLFCFQVGEESPDPKASTSDPTHRNGSTTSPSSETYSPAPDGPGSTSSTSPSPTSSVMLG